MPAPTRDAAPNAAQIEHWNSAVSATWIEFQEQLDQQIGPLGHEAQRVLALRPGERVLDVGCGCGATSLELAAQVGERGAVLGLDISAPMLAVARQRVPPSGAARPEFKLADAQTEAFGAPPFDAAFSRFGVMFFAEPLAAFANLRTALRPGGRLAFTCWRPLAENPWMQVPMGAAMSLLPPQPPSDPLAPGPFAFADPQRVRGILAGAGFADIRIDAYDTDVGGASLERTAALALRIGPLGALLREHPQLHDRVVDSVFASIKPYATPKGVLMPAAVWIVRANR